MAKIDKSAPVDGSFIYRDGRHLGSVLRDFETGLWCFLRGAQLLGMPGDLDYLVWWFIEYGFVEGEWPRDHEKLFVELRDNFEKGE